MKSGHVRHHDDDFDTYSEIMNILLIPMSYFMNSAIALTMINAHMKNTSGSMIVTNTSLFNYLLMLL